MSGVAIAALALGVLTPLGAAAPATAAPSPSGVAGVESVGADLLPTPQISAVRSVYKRNNLNQLLSGGEPIIGINGNPATQLSQVPEGVKPDEKWVFGSGVAWDQVTVGNTVFVGGKFEFARPAGEARGTVAEDGSNRKLSPKDTTRSNFLAYDLTTGALRSDIAFAFNGQVRSLSVSPDQKRLYVGGEFTTVNSQTRNRLAAFDITSPDQNAGLSLSSTFTAGTSSRIQAVAATNDTVYVGGKFTSAVVKSTDKTGEARTNAAAFDTATGAVRPWRPTVGNAEMRDEKGASMNEVVTAMVVNPAEGKLVLGGTFRTVNGQTARGMAAVNVTDGKSVDWKIGGVVPSKENAPPMSVDFAAYGLASLGSSVYGTMGPGNFEGTFKASWKDGTVEWLQDCHGDSYSVAPTEKVVYVASHAHDCSNVGGFGNYAQPKGWYRALALTNQSTATVKPWKNSYGNFAGQPAPTVLNWYPEFDTGSTTGQGPWDMATAGDNVLVGGEFQTVNGQKQDGLARFAPKAKTAHTVGPQASAAEMKPEKIVPFSTGVARITWGSNWDWDDASLTYDVIRNGDVHNPVFSTGPQASPFWKWRASGEATGGRLPLPGARITTFTGVDTGVKAGQTYTYQIRTTDGSGNSTIGDPVSFTMTDPKIVAPVTSYDKKVLADQPAYYWNLNETTALGHAKDIVRGNDARNVSAPARLTSGIETKEKGASLNMTGTRAPVYGKLRQPVTDQYTAELWFAASKGQSGVLLSLQNTENPASAGDRRIYLDGNGSIMAANWNGTTDQRIGVTSYTDGRWHHVAVTVTDNTQSIYVDGTLKRSAAYNPALSRFPEAKKATAFWMIGSGYAAFPKLTNPTKYLGYLDNVAVYPRALDAATIQSHVASRGAVTVVPPTAQFTATPKDLELAVDGSSSVDPAKKGLTYAWDFGDGTTAATAKASHTYAASGAYTVTLTVTDANKKSSSVSKQIKVMGSGVITSDTFGRTASSGWGATDTGEAWSVSAKPAEYSVSDGTAVISTTAGQTRTATLPTVQAAATDSTVSFRIDEKAVGAQYVSILGREIAGKSYSARAVLQPDGKLQIQLFGANGQLGKTVSVGTYSLGQVVKLRLLVGTPAAHGTTLSAKVWTAATEPTDWAITATDATAELQAKGSVGLRLYVAGSGAATTVHLDDYVVRAG